MSSKELTAEEIEAAFAGGGKDTTRCTVGRIIHEHPHGDVLAAKVDDVVHYSSATIIRVFKNLGLGSMSKDTMTKHRRGECRCYNGKTGSRGGAQ